MIMKKVFILSAAGDDTLEDPGKHKQDSKVKMKKRIEKAKTM